MGSSISQLLASTEKDKRNELLNIITNGSIMTWQHINMLGEYDFRNKPANLTLMEKVCLKNELQYNKQFTKSRNFNVEVAEIKNKFKIELPSLCKDNNRFTC